jgi:hypothetical protein
VSVSEDTPQLVVDPGQLCAVDASPGSMVPIPGSRMFEIGDALKVFRRNNPGSMTFDASQGDGYYAFLDMAPWLERAGMKDTAELGTMLAEGFGIAVVPGVYFSGAGSRWIRFSYALEPETTRGATERLWAGLSEL